MVTLKGLDSSKIQSDQTQDQTKELTEVGYVMSYQVITGNRKMSALVVLAFSWYCFSPSYNR